jgi:peptidoglycan/LPS O-acetylase OafA/YrhL
VATLWLTIAVLGKAQGWPTRPGLWAEIVAMLLFTAVMLKRFEWPFFAFLGRISYSAYLFHFAVIDVLATFLPPAAGLANFALGVVGAGLGTVAVAWTSSRTLEAWSVNLGRYIVGRLDSSAPDQKAV